MTTVDSSATRRARDTSDRRKVRSSLRARIQTALTSLAPQDSSGLGPGSDSPGNQCDQVSQSDHTRDDEYQGNPWDLGHREDRDVLCKGPPSPPSGCDTEWDPDEERDGHENGGDGGPLQRTSRSSRCPRSHG